MRAMLFILSCPVPLADGAFGVVVGTGTGARIRRFAAQRWARWYYTLLLTIGRAMVEAPIDLVVIDDAADGPALWSRVESEYERRGLAATCRPFGDRGVIPSWNGA